MSDFTDNGEGELSELFEDNSLHAGDSDAFETYLGYLDNIGIDDMDAAEEAISDFDDNYQGTAPSLADFAEGAAEEAGDLSTVPDYIKPCIDWEAVWDRGLCYSVDSYGLPSGEFGFVWVH